jgi:hypothetical protein
LPFASIRARLSALIDTVPSESSRDEVVDDISDLRSLGRVLVSAFASIAIRLATVEPAVSSSTHAIALSASELESLSSARGLLDRLLLLLRPLLRFEEAETEVEATEDVQADEVDALLLFEYLDTEEFADEDAGVAICLAVDPVC